MGGDTILYIGFYMSSCCCYMLHVTCSFGVLIFKEYILLLLITTAIRELTAINCLLEAILVFQEKEDGQRWRRPSPGEAELHCLQALLSHTVLPRHRKLLVEKGVLPLLQRVVQEHPQDIQLHSLVAQMVANLALDSALHRPLFRAGGTLTLSVVFKLLYLLIKSKLQVCWSVCVTCDLILCQCVQFTLGSRDDSYWRAVAN